MAGVTGQIGNTSNKLNYPWGIHLDWSNTLYIADWYNHRIQKYLKNASFGETVAGQASGVSGSKSDFLSYPYYLKVDYESNIIVTDRGNSRIQLWRQGATNGTTIAGAGIIK